MFPELLSALIGGATALVAAVLARLPQFFRDGRASVAMDLEIYNALPAESAQKHALLKRIDDQLRALDSRREARRDPVGIAGALFLIVVAAIFSLGAIGVGGGLLFALPAMAFIALLGIFGLKQSLPRLVRDARGNPLGGTNSARV